MIAIAIMRLLISTAISKSTEYVALPENRELRN